MVLAVVVTRIPHGGARGNTCVMLEETERRQVTQDESFVLCAAFRYAQGRNTYAMSVVVNHICKQLDRMSAIDIQQFLLEIDRRRKYGGPWGLQEEDHVNRLEKELRGKLK